MNATTTALIQKLRGPMLTRKKSLRDAYADKLRARMAAAGSAFTPAVLSRKGAQGQQDARPARKAGLKKVSSKRAKENRIYTERRKAFLIAHPTCDAHHALVALDSCAPATEVHHMAGRGKNFLNEDTWLPVCQGCHLTIHAHPNTARELGFIAPRGA